MLPFLESAATHSGRFHSDDVLAAALLVAAFPAIRIVRTREPHEIASHPLAFDVGGEYDPSRLRLDHHFAPGPRRADGTELSSVGLLFQLAGPELLHLAGAASDVVDRLARIFEHNVVRPVDAFDTGALRAGPFTQWLCALTMERPLWDATPSEGDGWNGMLDAAFNRQLDVVAKAIRRMCARAASHLELQGIVAAFMLELQLHAAPARSSDLEAIERAQCFVTELLRRHTSPELPVILPSPLIPVGRVWRIAERASGVKVDQAIWCDVDGRWRVQSMWSSRQGGVARVPLPEAWAGLSGDALVAASGIPDAVFCHPHRFVAGFLTLEGAQQAAAVAREERRRARDLKRSLQRT